jgi:hypothetical protein
MESTNESANSAVETIKDALRYLGDASYAILPEDVAHRLAEFKKSLLGGVRCVIDKDIEWIEARVEGGDRLREEWRKRHAPAEPEETTNDGI